MSRKDVVKVLVQTVFPPIFRKIQPVDGYLTEDDDFGTIVKSVQWGRHIYDSVSRYIQFQLCGIITAVIVKTVCHLPKIPTRNPLPTCTLVWLYVITDVMAAVAFTSEPPPSVTSLQRKPYSHTRPLLTRTMLKNIIGQIIYQTAVLFALMRTGEQFFDFASTAEEGFYERLGVPDALVVWPERNTIVSAAPDMHSTFVLNVFVTMTFANELNARSVHGERNIFKGLHRSFYFIVIWLFQWALQYAHIQAGGWWGYAVDTRPMPLSLWLWSLVFGFGSLTWQQLLFCIPTQRVLPKWCVLGKYAPERDQALDGMLRETGNANMMEGADESGAPVHAQPVMWMRSLTRMHSQFQNIQILERNMARSYRLPRLHALPNRYRDRVSYLNEDEHDDKSRPVTSGTDS